MSSHSALQGVWEIPFLAQALGPTCIIRTLVEAKVSPMQSWVRAARLPLTAPVLRWAGAGSAPMPNPSDSSVSVSMRLGGAERRIGAWVTRSQLGEVAFLLCTQGPSVVFPKALVTYYIYLLPLSSDIPVWKANQLNGNQGINTWLR